MPATAVHAPAAPADKSSGKISNFWRDLKQTASEWISDNVMSLSASVAFYTFLSLAPLLIIMLKIVSIAFRGPAGQQKVRDAIAGQLGPASGQALVETILAKGSQPGQGVVATIIGLLILLFGASSVFGELQQSMNTIWGVKPKPNQGIWGFIRTRILSFGMILGIGFLLLVSLFVSTALAAIAKGLTGDIKIVSFLGDLAISLVVVAVLFAAIFKFLPDVKIGWKYVWLGAVLTAVLFAIGKWVLTLYLRFGSTTSPYGAAGSLAAVLIWVYYSAYILFFGAEFTKVYARNHGHRIQPSAHAELIRAEEPGRVRQRENPPAPQKPRPAAPDLSVSAYLNRSYPGHSSSASAASQRATYLAAGAGLAVGALAGAYGARKIKETAAPAARQIAAVRLDERLHEVERKLGRVARIRDYLEQANVNERIDQLQREIRDAARAERRAARRRAARDGWLHHLARAVKQYV